jgi:hypothetical protein
VTGGFIERKDAANSKKLSKAELVGVGAKKKKLEEEKRRLYSTCARRKSANVLPPLISLALAALAQGTHSPRREPRTATTTSASGGTMNGLPTRATTGDGAPQCKCGTTGRT